MTKPSPPRGCAESLALLLPLRLVLGGLFLFAAWNKLFANPFAKSSIENPAQAFAESIQAFRILPVESAGTLIKLLTFTIPWAEAIAGLLLVVGLFTRAAATLISFQLVIFTAAILSVIFRGIDTPCGCFGKFDWPCTGNVMGWCHVWRDVVMLLMGLILAWRGGGLGALDHLCPFRARTPGIDSGGTAA